MTKGEELARQLVDCNMTVIMGSRYYCVPYSLARDIVEALKDCEERKTGKWVYDGCVDRCSNCRASRDTQLWEFYCGRCGVKMEVDE